MLGWGVGKKGWGTTGPALAAAASAGQGRLGPSGAACGPSPRVTSPAASADLGEPATCGNSQRPF